MKQTTRIIIAIAMPFMVLVLNVNMFAQPLANYLEFDGVNDYVNLGNSNVLKPTAALTLEVWIFNDNWATLDDARFINNTQGGGYSLGAKDGMIEGVVRMNDEYQKVLTSVDNLSVGWHHFALTCDGYFVKIYVDRAIRNTVSAGADYPIQYSSDNCTFLGAKAGSECSPEGEYFNGFMDDVRIWSKAKVQQEIIDNLYLELTGNESGLVGYWKLNEISGTIANDETSNENDGSLINMPSNPWGQLMEETSISLTGVSYSSTAWGDYDNDGDLDILLTGWDGSSPITKIYQNNGSGDYGFTEQTSIDNLPGVQKGSVVWGDYDNDGNLDILLTGETDSNVISKVYKNNGNNTFTEMTNISLWGVNESSVAWGDYNNDGDLDILLTGAANPWFTSRIYKNNGDNTFTEQNSISLTDVRKSAVAWGDYDNDRDLDFILSGDGLTELYTNNGDGTFNRKNAFLGYDNSSVAWGDYNNDGLLDVVISGQPYSWPWKTRVYKNRGNGIFIHQSDIDIPAAVDGSIAWGDYNNDGNLDILFTCLGGYVSKIFKNNGDNGFVEQSGISLLGVINSSGVWGDYDNDGDLDVLITGNGFSKIYKNNYPKSNATPNAPTNLSSPAVIKGSDAILSWDAATDNETPSAGLSYNIRIGTTPGASDIMDPMSISSTGFRKIPVLGNVNLNTRWSIKDLPIGTYYWSVQAIDAAFAGSEFSPEESFNVYAQFEETSLEFTGVDYSSQAWGDYDNDGDLDILLTGNVISNQPQSIIYKNNGDQTFTEQSSITLTDVSEGSSAWGDYDNDGDLDILLTGNVISNQPQSIIYKNNGDQTFTEQSEISLTNVYNSSVAWGDYDNDGLLDILLTGWIGTSGVSKIYRNNGPSANSGWTFTEQNSISLTAVWRSSVAWGDYDNDGDYDILLTGYDGSSAISKIYSNNGPGNPGFTEESSINLTGIQRGSAAWGDYDNDGYLDILLTGEASTGNISKIFKNNGSSTGSGWSFTALSGTPFVGVGESAAAWGDYNNDGYLDILLTGKDNTNTRVSKLYKNNTTGGFVEHLGLPFIALNMGSVDWGDYDNDGDLDIFLSGWTGGPVISKLYENKNTISNTPPSAPANLTGIAGTIGSNAVLSWDAASDNETPSAGLSYNLRVGTTPGSGDIIGSMANTNSGFREIPARGNMEHNISRTIKNLAIGAYYWSVQTIDHCFSGSAFATEASFNISGIPDAFLGNALDFNGTDNFVNCGTSPQITANNPRTIEAWAYVEDFNGAGIFQAGKPGADREDFSLRTLYADDEWRIQLWGSDDFDMTLLGSKNSWHHYALTYDGASVKLYFDGELKAWVDVVLETETNDVFFGRWRDYYLLGKIDELSIWNHARTQTELRENMHRTLSQDETGLIGYWQFNQSSGTIAADKWLGNNGTLNNATDDDWVASGALWKRWEAGAKDNVWGTAANWSTTFSPPTSNDMVLIQSGGTQPTILNEPETPALCDKLKIESTATLTLSAGKALTVLDSIYNEAGTSGLVLKSNESGTASLIHENAEVEATVERYIPQYVGAAGWHDLSSPVAAQAIRPGFVPNENPIPGSNDFYKYDELTDYWINTKDNSGNWNTNFEDDFVVGRGYNVAYANDETKSFSGELNVGDFTFDETTSPAITYTADGGNGWNLMGNPYPSALDWDQCTKENIDGAVYTYDGDAGQYKTWSAGIGNLTDGIIPPMNGFFIKASANPELTIPNSSRVHTLTNFYKEKNYVEDLLVLKVEGNGFSDKTFIHFNADASNDFDSDFDAYKLSGISEAPQLYTKAGDSKLSINVLPYTNEEIVIPLCLKVGNDGEYKISVSENTFWETVDISLKDLESGILYDLRTINPPCRPGEPMRWRGRQLTINQSTTNPDRFLLLINGATAIQETNSDDGIEIYSYGDQIFIKTEDPGDVQVAVYNLLGQNVLSQTLTGFETLSEFTTAKPGFYLVVVQTNEAMKVKKVFVK